MTNGNNWYEAYSRSGIDLPEVKWETAYRPRIEKTNFPQSQLVSLTQAEIQALIRCFINGPEEEVKRAAKILSTVKPHEAINPLFEVANGSKTKDVKRRQSAILTIAQMVDPSIAQAVAQSILNLPKVVDLNPTICMALGLINNPIALPFLYKILRDGISLVIFSSFSADQQKTYAVLTRAYALVAIAMIGSRDSISTLAMEAEREFFCQDYSDNSDNLLTNSNNLGLALLGAAASAYTTKRKNARAAASMVDPDVGLNTVISFPAATKMTWMLQHRVTVLKVLCALHGAETLESLLPQAKNSFQRLFISLPITQLGNTDPDFVNPILGSCKSSNRTERILAYDGLIKIYAYSKISQLEPWVLAGLSDKDSLVQTTTAASLLYNKAGNLVQNALALTQSKSVDMRMAVVPPLMSLAIKRSPFAVEVLDRMARTEIDKGLREMVCEFMRTLPEAQEMFDPETRFDEESEETATGLSPQVDGPKWSSFTPKICSKKTENS